MSEYFLLGFLPLLLIFLFLLFIIVGTLAFYIFIFKIILKRVDRYLDYKKDEDKDR